jgi:amino acid adenylation domain-containing protein
MNKQQQQPVNKRTGLEIAVIGMAGRFPGASNIETFWQNLRNGVESITFLTDEELRQAGVDEDEINDPDYVKVVGGVLEGREYFDAGFFDYLPQEAEVMEPSIRVFHEVVWEALEDAGYEPGAYDGQIGLYAGASSSFYWESLVFLSGKNNEIGEFVAAQLMDTNFLSTRVSYKLNLKGPTVAVQTACSTSLVAIHMAGRALLTGECKMALAGGVTVSPRNPRGYLYREGMIYSSDGHIRAFDAEATGVVFGSGAGAVLLKPMKDAEAEGDHIYAVIKGSAVNNDGCRKVGYAAPSVKGQSEVIRAAMRFARIKPETVTYIEAHGTGTPLGDPVEIEALTRAFNVEKKQFCAVGSVKTNVGHLDAAAGVAGFIKTVLALKNRTIPPILNYRTPNPRIDLRETPFYVNTRLKKWHGNGTPLRAGVSAFGIGGTNAHVLLEEAPPMPLQKTSATAETHRERPLLLQLSAATETALETMTQNLVRHFKRNPRLNLADAAYTLQVGRKEHPHRKVQVCHPWDGIEEICDTFTGKKSSRTITNHALKGKSPVIFIFPGLGGQYRGMGNELYRAEPRFCEEIDRCAQYLKRNNYDLWNSPLFRDETGTEDIGIKDVQVAVLVFELALAHLIMHWGIRPHRMIGYSFGEYAAAVVSGVMSREDALKLILERGELIQKGPAGAMTGVPLPKDEVSRLIAGKPLSLAIDNGPSTIVAGPKPEIEAFEKEMKQRRLICVRLQADRALHSHQMEPIMEDFRRKVEHITLDPPQIPFISNVTGKEITAAEAQDPAYWVRHMRSTVRFAESIQRIVDKPGAILLEVGPGSEISALMGRFVDENDTNRVIPLNRGAQQREPEHHYLTRQLGRLWLQGKQVDWNAYNEDRELRRVPLPAYPFEGQKYWLEGNPFWIATDMIRRGDAGTQSNPQQESDKKENGNYYIPVWKQAPIPGAPQEPEEDGTVALVFCNEGQLGNQIREELGRRGYNVIAVRIGETYTKDNEYSYRINPAKSSDYDQLFAELKQRQQEPRTLLHLWNVREDQNENREEDKEIEKKQIRRQQLHGFYSLVYQVQAMGNAGINRPVHLIAVTTGRWDITGEERLTPGNATIQGPLKVIPHEYPNIDTLGIDISIPRSTATKQITKQLIKEIQWNGNQTEVAYRGTHRWVQTLEPHPLQETGESPHPRLRQQGVYLVTGGLGGIGLEIARHLAKQVQAKLILVSRTPMPLQNWNPETDAIREKIRKINEIERLGAEVMTAAADVAHREQMETVIREAEKRFGPINGVIHAAGQPDGGVIRTRTPETMEPLTASKLEGTINLDHLLAHRRLDFFVLGSSLGALIPAFGQVGYTAVNAFLDAYAHKKYNENPETLTVSINWDRWKNTGMAAAVEDKHRQMTGSEMDGGITPTEALEAFDRIIAAHRPQVAVSTGDLLAIIQQTIQSVKPGNNGQETETATDTKIEAGTESAEPKKTRNRRPQLSTDYVAPREPLEKLLAETWQEFFGLEQVGVTDDFFELGGDSLKGMMLVNKYNAVLGEIVHINVIFDAPDIQRTAAYLREHYGRRTAQLTRETPTEAHHGREESPRLDDLVIENFCRAIPALPPRQQKQAPRNPSAIFILSPPRSGSTLLRVILAGHPGLFAPPELGLMHFDTLEQYRPSNQGAQRALMEIHGCTAEEAKEILRQMEDQNTDTRGLFRYMQERIGQRRLVDKSPGYVQDIEILNRIEKEFENALYIHLLRHPYGMIRSFEEAKLDLTKGDNFLEQFSLSRRQFAELSWTIGHRNTQRFLEKIPAHRKLTVTFEDLVGQPGETVETICRFLGIEPNPEMLQPYKDSKQRMTDGLYAIGSMIGDVKFHRHKNIDSSVADTWKKEYTHDFLGDETMRRAKAMGYRMLEPERNSVEPGEKKEYYPLSSQQRRLYALQQIDADGTGYNMTIRIPLQSANGEIQKYKLEQTFKKLIQRHESLRTTFVTVQNEPVQRIHENQPFEVEIYDVRENGGNDGDGGNNPLDRIVASFVRPFRLDRGPLMRAGFVKTENGGILMVDIHHIISDGVSNGILADQFRQYYNGQEQPEITPQYRDFARWQQQRLENGRLLDQQQYWQKKFEGSIPILQIPTDYPRPAMRSFEGRRIGLRFEPAEEKALRQQAREKGVTQYIYQLALFNVLMYKITGQQDIVIGTPTAGRSHIDIETVVGMIANTLALRNKPEHRKSFNEFLQDVKTTTIQDYKNQDYPFEELVETVGAARDTSRNPLFDVVFSYNNRDEHQQENHHQEKQQKDNDTGEAAASTEPENHHYEGFIHLHKTAKFDMTMLVAESGGRLDIAFEYGAKLFNQKTVRRYTDFYKRIAAAVRENPGIKLADIEIISPEEKHRVQYEFNRTEADYPRDKTIHRLFEEQTQRTPDRIAVVGRRIRQGIPVNETAPPEAVTYRQLNRLADRVADTLAKKGVRPGTIVSMKMERSIEMIAGIVGIMKTGAAYLPIDPENPGERSRYIEADSNAAYRLTGKQVLEAANIDRTSTELYRRSVDNDTASPDDPCYIIYTSGTTGKPKGVIIEHRNVVRLMINHKNPFDFSASDVWTMFHTYSFDFSVWEMYGALLYGGKLVQVPRRITRDPERFLQILNQQQVTVLNQTPTAFYGLQAEEMKQSGAALNIRYIVFGGEALAPGRLKQWKQKYPATKLVNMFGITETTVHVTYKEITDEEIEKNIGNIGGPIPTMQTYIMKNKTDGELGITSVGIYGELCVGGDGVGRGYLNAPEQTAEKFVTDPYNPGRRLYRSGDRARLMENGDMEYRGRIDKQVELRGHRIEPEEIEYHLMKYPGIKQAHVAPRSDAGGNTYLCAYLVSEQEQTSQQLREYLAEKLPAYMIPAYTVTLESLPLTPNGKINTGALPAPVIEEGDQREAPANPVEEQLLKYWQNQLEQEKIGVNANYFNIGGDSIKAIKLLNTINSHMGTKLKIPDLYANETVRKLAEHIGKTAAAEKESAREQAQRHIEALRKQIMAANDTADLVRIEDIYPMSDIEKGIAYHYLKNRAESVFHDQFIFQVNYPAFKPDVFRKAMEQMVEKHQILRTTFNMDDYPEAVQIVHRNGLPEIETTVRHEDISSMQKKTQEEHITRYLREDRRQGFGLNQLPMWRLRTFALGSDQVCVIWSFHHAIMDGWSNAALMTELNNTYLALKENSQYKTEMLACTYKDYVVEQIAEKNKPETVKYWQTELDDYRKHPLAGVDATKKVGSPRMIEHMLGNRFLQQLTEVAMERDTTVKNICFGAYVYMLGLMSYSNDIVVGLITNNRPVMEDGEKVVGCFLNPVPVRVRIPVGVTWARYQQQIDEKLLELKKYDRMPFYEIVKLLGKTGDEDNPVYDVAFNYVDFHVFNQAKADEPGPPEERSPGTTGDQRLALQAYERLDTQLHFDVSATFGNLSVSAKYAGTAFDDERIRRLCRGYETILQRMIREADTVINKNEIVMIIENNVLSGFNDDLEDE